MRKIGPLVAGWIPVVPTQKRPESAPIHPGRFTRPEGIIVPPRETIHLAMGPDETPIVVTRRDPHGTPIVKRPPANPAMELHKGSPVVSIDLPKGDAAIIGPNLEDADDRKMRRVERCMDRITVSYDEAGNTAAFALADGASQGAGSACVADAATIRAIDAQRRLSEHLTEAKLPFSEAAGIALVRDVENHLRGRLPPIETLRVEYSSNYLPKQTYGESMRENMARMATAQKIVGATTLITGSFRQVRHRDTGEPHEMTIITQVGDGGYVVIGPGTTTTQGNFDQRAPAQISPAKVKGVDEAGIHTTAVPLKKDQILLVFSDGLQKSPAFPSIEAVQQRAQALFDHGVTDPCDIIDQLLVDARGDGETWADDVSIFAHLARV